MTTRKDKAKQIIELVRQVEDEYGSVGNAPADDERLIKTRMLYKKNDAKVNGGKRHDKSKDEKIKRLWEAGASDTEIAKQVKCSSTLVVKVRKKLGLKQGNLRRYILIKRNGEIIKLKNQTELANALGVKILSNFDQLKKYAEKRGDKIMDIVTHEW